MDADEIRTLLGEMVFERAQKYRRRILQSLSLIHISYVEGYMANKTPFETAMQDVKNIFGLTLPTDPDAANAGKLLLTDYEVQNLRTAYERTLKVGSASQKDMSQQDYELYGTYILSLIHILTSDCPNTAIMAIITPLPSSMVMR